MRHVTHVRYSDLLPPHEAKTRERTCGIAARREFSRLAHVRACVTPPKSGGCALERVRVEEPAQRTCVPDSLSRMTVLGRDLSLTA